MLKDDWAMNQISSYAKLISRVALDRDSTEYRIGQSQEADSLYFRLSELIQDGKINEAENLLYEELDTENLKHLELAVDFYTKLNEMGDPTLEAGGFSREEIDDGLRDIADSFGIRIL